MYPPSCPTGNVPAAAPYFVTGPPLGAGDHRSPLREARRPRRAVSKPQQPPRYFSGMVPTAARRAKPVQRSCSQGLQGNPDACHPRRGSACNVTVYKTGGDARLVFANQTQRTAAMSPRIGGSRVGEAPRPFFPPISSGRNGGARRAGIRREAGPPPDGRILSAPTGLAVGVPRWSGPPPGDAPVSGQKSAPPGIRAALVFTALRGNTPNQGWQAAACRGCCAGR